jgi:predicted negative regulator of RcsB-dependent stress response
MAALDMQEQEQIDLLKAWWKENGKWFIAAAVVGLFGYAGMHFWKSHEVQQNADAGKLFGEVVKQSFSNDPKRINDAADAVAERFGNTAYAARSQLMAAQVNLQAKDNARAKSQLRWVIDHSSQVGLQDTARMKLASVLLDEKAFDEALKLLDATHPEAFTGLYSDLKGDVLSAQGKTAEAIAAYQIALDKIDAKSNYRNLIQLKLEGLKGAK